MTSSDREDDAGVGRPRRRGLAVGLSAAALVALALLAAWMLRGDRASPDADEPSKLAASAPDAHQALPEPPPPHAGTSRDLPDGVAAPVEAMAPKGAAAGDGWHDLRGVAVRASDESPVVGATIVAVSPGAGPDGRDEVMEAKTGRDGGFSFYVPRDVNFRVRLPASGRPADGQPDGRVQVRLEWANGDTQADAVRLVLETGWQLAVLVIDGESRPRAGVLVKGAGREAKSDAEGRCVLLDLPASGQPISLTLQSPGAKPVTYAVEPPEAGLLRKDVTLKGP
jgi:hypothetical protein